MRGTTIKNTTFDELVTMVKEDCSQFQEDYDNPDPENGIDWGYREAEPPKTEEEVKYENKKAVYTMRLGLLGHLELNFNEDQKARFIEFYGDMENLSTEEQLAIAKRVIDSGGIDLGVLGEE